MHELSIVLSIVEIAENELQKAQAHQIDKIELEIGTLAGVEMDALDFAWEAAVKNTVLAHAERKIQRIEAQARCLDCGLVYPIQQAWAECPACGEFFNEILQGKELRVKSLIVS
ncbi:MAG: hydrogenase maturation nickel metallochaperone HypA [Microscillaceae bacterium]|jgi:hydrogenase nickel incorporation protein HypA/HybF|nr:hydrogenase maturation nickel metallochaperone HypA [Microscillaceae bacterium]